jgi:MFS family permease
VRYGVLVLLCLAAVIAYVQRSAISLPARDIQQELDLGVGAMGSVMSAWYLGYALLQVPAGWLADRWGGRRALALYAALWSVFTGLTGLATGFWSLAALWGLMGLAQAGIFPAAAKAIGDWFPDTERALASGLLASSMAGGAALAPILTAWLLESFSWQDTFVLYALPGFAWAFAFLLFTPDTPHGTRALRERVAWLRLATSVPMALLCLQQFLRAAAMVFFYTWFPTYLQEARGLTLQEAGRYAAWVGLGAMLGGLTGGHVSDWLLRRTGSQRLSRQGIAIAGMTTCALLAGAAYFVTDVHTAILVLSLGAFAGTFGGVSGYSVAIAFGGRHVGTVFSVMNMCGNFGAFLFPIGIAWFVERTGRWDLVLFVFSFCFAADAVCWALLNPRAPLFEEPHAPDPHAAEPVSSRAGSD